MLVAGRREYVGCLAGISSAGSAASLRLTSRGVKVRKQLDSKWERMKRHFDCRASAVSTDMIRKYVIECQKKGMANASINRDLSALKKAFSLAYKSTPRKIAAMPVFPKKLDENARHGFIEQAEFDKLYSHAEGLWFKTMLLLGYTFGFRRGELLAMKVEQFSSVERTIRLWRGATKNKRARHVLIEDEGLYQLVRACCEGKKPNEPLLTRENTLSAPIVDSRESWYRACVRAGLGKFVCLECKKDVTETEDGWHCEKCGNDLIKHQVTYDGAIFHDLRRSAVRNMVRRGVSEKVAMEISGHLTRSVFDRYDITADSDLREAAKKIAAGRETSVYSPNVGVQNGVQRQSGNA